MVKKQKKDLRVEIVKALEGKKEFTIYWSERTYCSIVIEAKDEKEAQKIFLNGDYDYDKVDYGDSDYEEESIEIEEVNK